MITCTIESGESIVDDGLEVDIERYIAEFARGQKEIRFLCSRKIDNPINDFSDICLQVIDAYRVNHPEKDISVLFVADSEEITKCINGSDNGKYKQYYEPSNFRFYSGFLQAPSKQFKDTTHSSRKNSIRWAIQQADVLLCYYYEILSMCNAPDVIRSALKRTDINIVNFKRVSTELQLLELVNSLEERRQFVFKELNNGRNAQSLAEELNISTERVKQLFTAARRNLIWKFRRSER